MKIVKIDPTICICCGTCAAIAENLFEINPDDGVARVIVPHGELKSVDDEDLAEQCVQACPAAAISIEDKK